MIEIIPNWHPIFVHFTVALLSTSVVFYLLAQVTGISQWRFQWLAVARWTLWLGAGFAVVTAFFGWLAFNSVEHDDPSHLAMIEHRNWALGTLTVFLGLALWSIAKHRADRDLGGIFSVLLVIAAGLLASTAWHGAELVYRHGLGVMSLPDVDQHHHGAGGEADHALHHDHEGEHEHEHAHADEGHDHEAGEHEHDPVSHDEPSRGSAAEDAIVSGEQEPSGHADESVSQPEVEPSSHDHEGVPSPGGHSHSHDDEHEHTH